LRETDATHSTVPKLGQPRAAAEAPRHARDLGERYAARAMGLSLFLHVALAAAVAQMARPVHHDEPEPIAVELVPTPVATTQQPAQDATSVPIAAAAPDRTDTSAEQIAAAPPPQPAEQQAELPPPAAAPPPPMEQPAPEPPRVESGSPTEEVAPPIPVMRPRPRHEPQHPAPVVAAIKQAEPAASAPAAPASAPQPAVQQAAAPPAAARTVDAALAKEALGRYAAVLHGLIEARKSYPPQALLRHEQGIVRLRIVVDQGGRLIEVTALSEAPAHLIEASVQATKAAAPFPALPTELGTPRATFELPITFRLE
jgi:TonB family protein